MFLYIFAGNLFRRKRSVPMAYFSYKLQRVPWKKSFCNTRCPAWSVVPVGIRVSLLFPATGVRNAVYLFFESSFFSVFFYKKKKIKSASQQKNERYNFYKFYDISQDNWHLWPSLFSASNVILFCLFSL